MNLVNSIKLHIKSKKITNIILSGGKSPLSLYSKLFSLDLDWDNINLFLLDERLVSLKSKNSNFNNINKILVKNNLNNKLKPLSLNYLIENNILKHRKSFNKELTICILGMGDDGHFASIFSKSKNFLKLIDLKSKPTYVKISKIGNPNVKRLTMNLSMIMMSTKIYLLLNNKVKYLTFLKAIKTKNYLEFPIYYLIKKAKNKTKVFYKSKELKFKII